MKTISLRLEDVTVGILEEKAKQQNITVSEYLRINIFPLIEGTKPLTLEQSLEKLERSLALLHVCFKPLQELLFDLQKLATEQIVKQEMEKAQNVQPENKSETQPETA